MWREKIKSILSWQKGREAKGRAEKKEFPELRGKQDKKELFQKAILQESRKAIQADFRTVSGMDSKDSGIFSGEKKRNDPAVFL